MSEFTQYITPDGLVYRFDTSDRFLMSETGYGMPPVDYLTQQGPYQHGETVFDYRLRPRVIQLVHRVNACSRSEYWASRAALLNVLRPNRGTPSEFATGRLRKVLPDGSRYDLDVTVEEGPLFAARRTDAWDEWAFTETIRFIAHDPIFYRPEFDLLDFANVTPGMLIPTVIPTELADTHLDRTRALAYTGTWLSHPHAIKITGPVTGPRIDNLTTGESLYFPAVTLLSLEWIEIDLRYGQKRVVDSAGTNRIGALSADSDLATWHIAPAPEAPGGVNTIRVRGDAINVDTRVEIRYYTRFIGI